MGMNPLNVESILPLVFALKERAGGEDGCCLREVLNGGIYEDWCWRAAKDAARKKHKDCLILAGLMVGMGEDDRRELMLQSKGADTVRPCDDE